MNIDIKKITVRGSIFMLLVLMICGCVRIQPYPYVFQQGETITLAIGSLDGAKKGNITVVYTPDTPPSTPIDLTANIKQVFKIYADKNSFAWNESSATESVMGSIKTWSGHGPWETVVLINLPSTMPTGTGIFSITTGVDVIAPNNAKRVEDVSVAAEILPSTGTTDLFKYFAESFDLTPTNGAVGKLRALPQVVVRPYQETGIYGKEAVAAAEYVLNVPITNTTTVPDYAVILNWDETPGLGDDKIQILKKRNNDEIRVMVISPEGNLNTGMVRFSLILIPPNTYSFTGATPSLTSATYYGTDGLPVTGTDPEVLLMYN